MSPEKRVTVRGAVYFCRQGKANAEKTGTLMLNFGGYGELSHEDVGQAIVAAFEAVGARVSWSGQAAMRISIHDYDEPVSAPVAPMAVAS